jgi:hypothetical protein
LLSRCTSSLGSASLRMALNCENHFLWILQRPRHVGLLELSWETLGIYFVVVVLDLKSMLGI